MLALFASPLVRDAALGVLLLVLVASGYGYYRWSTAEIASLRRDLVVIEQQADDLVRAKQQQDADLAVIKSAQDRASLAITQARDHAAQAARTVRAGQAPNATAGDPHSLQIQVNHDQAAMLQALEALTR